MFANIALISGLCVSDDFAWLCAHSGKIKLTVEVDSKYEIPEAHEMNNKAYIEDLSVDMANCTGKFTFF